MKITDITSCSISPQISPEQFVPEHFSFAFKKLFGSSPTQLGLQK